jgi:DNA-binding transcriptional MerR regulator/effector-binding domain-containing protein
VFRIGDFSRIARVSCRLLRYYDELGLLKPASVEHETGYRYYRAAQLPRLNRILVLKELGLSLEEVARVIGDNVSPAELRGMLLMRRTELERALANEAERLRHIETRIAQIDTEGELSVDDVILRAEPARQILSTRRVVASFSEARELIGLLCGSLRGRLPRETLGSLIAIAHAQEFELESIDVELGFILQRDLDTSLALANGATLTVRNLPAVERIATCVRVGLPEHAHLITAKIGRFVEANGYRLAGPSREVFLQPPRLERMEDSVVEMQFPIEKARDDAGATRG